VVARALSLAAGRAQPTFHVSLSGGDFERNIPVGTDTALEGIVDVVAKLVHVVRAPVAARK
jgi:hypothetical protein